MRELRTVYRPTRLDLSELERLFGLIADRLDQLEGRRGTPTFYGSPDYQGNQLNNVADATEDTQAPSYGQLRTRPASDIPSDPLPSGGDTADVQAALDLLDLTLASTSTDLTDHLADLSDPHDTQASQVESDAYRTGSGTLSATTVQAALEEIQDDLSASSWRYTYSWEPSYADGVIVPNGGHNVGTPQTHWDDLQGSVVALATVGVGVPSIAQVNSTPVYAYEFTNEAVAGNEKRVRATYQLSHRWQPETAVELHVHLITGNRTPGADEYVRFTFTHLWGEFGDVVSGAGSTLTGLIRIPAGTAPYTRLYADVGWISGTGNHESSILSGLIQRTSSNAADTFEESVFVEWLDVHFPVIKPGTAGELPTY